jgi:signal transduction histidine kinase
VTHELRTPLTSIRAFSEILRQDPNVELSERKRFLDIITKETERLTRLINQVLDLSKIESGRAEWHESQVDMKEVIADSVAGMGQVFEEKGIRVETRLPESAPRVPGDVDRIIQVILNLLSNAVKFCEPGTGRIEIALAERDGCLRVDVRDNGPGVSAENQRVIFDKFRQAGDTLTNKPQGTGLGLPISRHIVEHHGGKLWVESRPGGGACFSFTLPFQRVAAAA